MSIDPSSSQGNNYLMLLFLRDLSIKLFGRYASPAYKSWAQTVVPRRWIIAAKDVVTPSRFICMVRKGGGD